MVASSSEFQTTILRKNLVPDEYKLYRAALEWDLTDPIVIETRKDLKSEKRWQEHLEPYHHRSPICCMGCVRRYQIGQRRGRRQRRERRQAKGSLCAVQLALYIDILERLKCYLTIVSIGCAAMTKLVNRCARCGGRFGLISHSHWGLRFCRKACREQLIARAAKDRARVRGGSAS